MITYIVLDIAAVICALVYLRSWIAWRKRNPLGLPYPPGPPRLPIIGNILDTSELEEWEKGRQWGEKYGDLVYIENLGKPYLFVNSYDVAVELFEKRGHNYSSRPRNTMIELEGWDWLTVLMPYGDEHRKSRQFLHRFLREDAMSGYNELQSQAVLELLSRLSKTPEDFAEHIRFFAGQMILKIAYGHEVAKHSDPYIDLAEEGVHSITDALRPIPANFIPWLGFIPGWFPGAGFQGIAKRGRELSQRMLHEPYNMAKKKYFEGTGIPSMTTRLIEANLTEEGHIVDEEVIAKSTGIAYAAGADTTVSTLDTFMLAMVLHPAAQRRGQEELDRVIGKDNLPTIGDRTNLPYINAICSEILRWNTVTPLAAAHTATKDDIFDGYFIPAGITILPNAWAMLRNPKGYPEPEKFLPERWLPSEKHELPLEVNKIAFGFGRRICPGRHFAENSIFIAVASILSCFNIDKVVDESGQLITPKEEYTVDFVRHPKPFKCKITPRTLKTVALVSSAAESVE